MAKTYGVVGAGRRAAAAAATFLAAVALTPAAQAEPQRLRPTGSRAESSAHVAAATPVAVVDAFHSALARGDTRAVLHLLAEDVVIFEGGGVERNRAEYAAHHLGADAAFSAAVRRTLVSRSHSQDGGSAAVMSVETMAGTYRGRAINSRSVETMILRQVAGRWRISHIHWSSMDLAPK